MLPDTSPSEASTAPDAQGPSSHPPCAATPSVVATLLAAAALSACGGSEPSPADTVVTTDTEAARFLQQAQFSSSPAEITALKGSTYGEWLRKQLALPQGATGWDWLHNRPGFDHGDPMHPAEWYNKEYPGDFMIWSQLLDGADPVRRRMALALSEFFVVSLTALPISWRSQAIAAWWDTLVTHAFGNFRQLLEAVTLNPAMGVYLNTKGNRKADTRGRMPDENYSREVMQLFTIGLFQLNQDGTVKTDANGHALESYAQEDVSQLARVFTGYDFDYANDTRVATAGGGLIYPPAFVRRPMKVFPDRHSPEAKSFLGTQIAAGTPPQQALATALDTLFNHPNVGPFFGRQMIQRLVTSNPSPAYVSRVAAAFNNNGTGVRGDLRAVWTAILLDPEARGPSSLNDPLHGKVREPMLRFVQWARSFGVRSAAGSWKLFTLLDPARQLGQSPLRSPSVFNFFRPGYVPPGTDLATRKAVAPEFQIVHETTVGGYLNYMQSVIRLGIRCPDPQKPDHHNQSVQVVDVQATYTAELALADEPAALIKHLDIVLTAGRLPATQQTLMTDALKAMVAEQALLSTVPEAEKRLDRVSAAVLMVMASSAYLVQK